jgi:hypothetical protein
MSWFNHIASLSNPLELFSFYSEHIFTEQIRMVCLDIILILSLHGFYILVLTRLFQYCVKHSQFSKRFGGAFVMYFVAILLVIITHVSDIFLLALILDSLKIFPDSLTTFYYVSGMYTTIGSNSIPGPQWQSLSMLISFCGLFAFSISGAGLYSMLGFFIAENNKKQR